MFDGMTATGTLLKSLKWNENVVLKENNKTTKK